MPVLKKQCSICGSEFETQVVRQHTCSPECRDENLRRVRTKWMSDRYHAKNPVLEKSCPGCGKVFLPRSHKQEYCDGKCRDRHYWSTPEGRLKKAEKDKRYQEKNEERLREIQKASSKKYYHTVRKPRFGIADAACVGRNESGHFVETSGATRYKNVQMDNKRMGAHRKVWIQANGPIAEGLVIHHINKNPRDNRLENLCPMTVLEHNRIHAHDPWNKGKEAPQISASMMGHPVSEQQVERAKKTWKGLFIESMRGLYLDSLEGVDRVALAAKHGLTLNQVANRLIKYKKDYLKEDLEDPLVSGVILARKEQAMAPLRAMYQDHKSGMTYVAMAAKYNLSRGTVKQRVARYINECLSTERNSTR